MCCRDAYDAYSMPRVTCHASHVRIFMSHVSVQDLYRSLRQREQKNSRLLLMRGELPEDATLELKELSDSYQQLQQQSSLLSELMDRDPIVLPDIKSDDTEDLMMTITMHTTDAVTGESLLFDDEDTRLVACACVI